MSGHKDCYVHGDIDAVQNECQCDALAERDRLRAVLQRVIDATSDAPTGDVPRGTPEALIVREPLFACPARDPSSGLTCSRENKHGGRHIAISDRHRVLAEWMDPSVTIQAARMDSFETAVHVAGVYADALNAVVGALDGLVFHRRPDGTVEVVKGASTVEEWGRLVDAMARAKDALSWASWAQRGDPPASGTRKA